MVLWIILERMESAITSSKRKFIEPSIIQTRTDNTQADRKHLVRGNVYEITNIGKNVANSLRGNSYIDMTELDGNALKTKEAYWICS